MRESELPSPDVGGKGFNLRKTAASTISAMEVTANNYSDGRHPKAAALKAFFDACSAAADQLDHKKQVASFSASEITFHDGQANQVGPVLTKLGTGAVTYRSSDTIVATVNPTTGAVTVSAPHQGFTVTIYADIAGDGTYRPGTASYTATIVP